MRLLMTSSAEHDVWHFTSVLSGQLAENHDTSVLVAVFGRQPASDGLALLRRVSHSGATIAIQNAGLPLDDEERASKDMLAEARAALRDLARQWGADVIHANHYFATTAEFDSTPVLLTAHRDNYSERVIVGPESHSEADSLYIDMVMESLAAASCVVAPSSFVADCLGRWFGYRGPVRVIPYAATPCAVDFETERRIDVITSGEFWEPAANFGCFTAAAASTADLAFAAVGPLVQPGMRRTRPIARSILFTGEASDSELIQMLANSKIYVSASLYDPTGVGSIQAARAGCSLLLSDTACYRSIWGDRATYFDPHDVSALQGGIRSLLRDAGPGGPNGSPAHRQAVTLHNAKRVAEAYTATYQRLALRRGIAL